MTEEYALYRLPNLQRIFKKIKSNSKVLKEFLNEYPESVNYFQYTDSGVRYCSGITVMSVRYKTSYTIADHLKIKNATYSCTIQLSPRQNRMLQELIGDELMSEAKVVTKSELRLDENYTKYTPASTDKSEDLCHCVIL